MTQAIASIEGHDLSFELEIEQASEWRTGGNERGKPHPAAMPSGSDGLL